MTNSPLITAASISRYYGQRRALDNISFTIHRGEIVCFLGPNGAGKSTLMQIICGVMAASSGAISIAGFDIIEQPLQAKQHPA
jgi:ABC-2 type transport system ATP-binding protein